MKRKTYHIEQEYPMQGDIFYTRVSGSQRAMMFHRQDSRNVWLTDGRRHYRRSPGQVRAIPITPKLLCKLGFAPSPTTERLVLDRVGLHFEAFERADTMHIEITPEGTQRKTIVCCDFVHELQHLKRLRIAGIRLPFRLSEL